MGSSGERRLAQDGRKVYPKHSHPIVRKRYNDCESKGCQPIMKTRSLTLFVALTLLLSACGAATPTPLSSTESAESAVAQTSSAATSTNSSVETPTSVPATESAVAPTSSAATSTHSLAEAHVEDLLARMTLDEKIGQMTQVEKNSIKPGDI